MSLSVPKNLYSIQDISDKGKKSQPLLPVCVCLLVSACRYLPTCLAIILSTCLFTSLSGGILKVCAY